MLRELQRGLQDISWETESDFKKSLAFKFEEKMIKILGEYTISYTKQFHQDKKIKQQFPYQRMCGKDLVEN